MRTPVDFPVDVYYLMDLSGSMFKEMKKITTLGELIGKYDHNLTVLWPEVVYRVFFTAKEMKEITKRFRLGFGTFVDKPLAPFIDTHPSM